VLFEIADGSGMEFVDWSKLHPELVLAGGGKAILR